MCPRKFFIQNYWSDLESEHGTAVSKIPKQF